MASKTYILAPNFTYKPNGPIQLGSIVIDPFRPAKSLSTLKSPPNFETVVEREHELSRENSRSLNLSIWASFIEAVSSNAGISRSSEGTQTFSIEELETRYLATEILDNDLELLKRLKEPRVMAAIKSGLFSNAPVYLITGVKVARGLTVRHGTGRSAGGSMEIGTAAAQAVGVSVGAEVGADRRYGFVSSFKAGDQDVVFAYQVHVVKVKGRKGENATVDIFESDAAFLHGEDGQYGEDGEENEEGFEISTTSVESLKEAAWLMEMSLEWEEVVGEGGHRVNYVRAN
ncbi:hypothetical protein EsH8_II_001162 [Colletotrichum jinshuiense]